MTSAESSALSAHSSLVSLIAEVNSAETFGFESRKGLSDSELFGEFYRLQYGEPPKEELRTLFLSVLRETEK